MTRDVRRVGAECFPIQLNRLVQIVLPVSDHREPVEGFRKCRLQRERVAERAFRGVVILLNQQHSSHVVMAACRRIQPHRLVQLHQRIGRAVRFEIARSELGAQLRVARLDLEPLLVARDIVAQNPGREVLLETREIP